MNSPFAFQKSYWQLGEWRFIVDPSRFILENSQGKNELSNDIAKWLDRSPNLSSLCVKGWWAIGKSSFFRHALKYSDWNVYYISDWDDLLGFLGDDNTEESEKVKVMLAKKSVFLIQNCANITEAQITNFFVDIRKKGLPWNKITRGRWVFVLETCKENQEAFVVLREWFGSLDRSVQRIEVLPLSDDKVNNLITSSSSKCNICNMACEFESPNYLSDKSLINEIKRWGGSHPYLLQLVCEAVHNNCSRNRHRSVSGCVGSCIETEYGDRLNSIQREIRIFLEVCGELSDDSIENLATDPFHIDPSVLEKLSDCGLTWTSSKNDKKVPVKLLWNEKGFRHHIEDVYSSIIVSVIDKKEDGREDNIIGTGFLVSRGSKIYVITCAHVIYKMQKRKGSDVVIRHPATRDFKSRVIKLGNGTNYEQGNSQWAGRALYDVAVLEILEVSAELSPLENIRLNMSSTIVRDFKGAFAYGYPNGYAWGSWMRGIDFCSHLPAGFSEITQNNDEEGIGPRIAEGASGAPVCNNGGEIYGMIHAYGETVAYLIPAKTISEQLDLAIQEEEA